jgi:hypothetical protein
MTAPTISATPKITLDQAGVRPDMTSSANATTNRMHLSAFPQSAADRVTPRPPQASLLARLELSHDRRWG